MNRIVLLLCGLAVGLGACDRVGPEETDDGQRGFFEAEVRQGTGGGFEVLEGPALFDIVTTEGNSFFVLRFASKLPNFADTTRLDFALAVQEPPTLGTYAVGDLVDAETDFAEVFAGCYRSPNFAGTRYGSESGEVVVTSRGGEQVEGRFEVVVYTLIQTGPSTSVRSRLTISGSFSAVRRETRLDPANPLGCHF